MTRGLALALPLAALLAGCAAGARPADPPPVPQVDCPPGPLPPAAPKPPRTLEAIVRYAYRLDEALVQSERARQACEAALNRLREYTDRVPL